jgi:hypothetical protein
MKLLEPLKIGLDAHFPIPKEKRKTHCSFAICFIPSNSTPVTFPFKYCLVGAPCGGASFGIEATGSGCWLVAREVTSLPFKFLEGVPVLWGAGLAAFVAPGRIAGDCGMVSSQLHVDDGDREGEDIRQVYQASHQP